jgi:hypothetical protein
MSTAERRFSIHEKECLTVFYGCEMHLHKDKEALA